MNRDFARRRSTAAGLLFEFRWTQPFYETFLGDGLDPYAALFESRNPALQAMAELYTPIRDLFRAVNETPDGQFAAVDRTSTSTGFIRLVAADSFMAEVDGILGYDGMNNVYLYRDRRAGASDPVGQGPCLHLGDIPGAGLQPAITC